VEVCDRIVDGDEPLKVSGGFEPLHDPLSSPCRQMRILRPVVEALVLSVLEIHAHSRPSRAVGPSPVGRGPAFGWVCARAFRRRGGPGCHWAPWRETAGIL